MELDMPDTTAELLDHPKYRKVRGSTCPHRISISLPASHASYHRKTEKAR